MPVLTVEKSEVPEKPSYKWLRNVYFINFIVLASLSVSLIIALIVSWFYVDTPFLSITTSLFGIYTVIFSILQLHAVFEPFLKKHNDDETSPASHVAIVAAILCIIIPLIFVTKFLWSPTFFANMLSSILLFINAISCISKNYRESALALYTTLGYVGVCLFFGLLNLLFGLSTFYMAFPVIGLYCLFCFAKSYEPPPTYLRAKVNYTDSLITTILAAIAFVIAITVVAYNWRTFPLRTGVIIEAAIL